MELVDNDDLLSEYVNSRDYVDILREFRQVRFESPEDFLSQLSRRSCRDCIPSPPRSAAQFPAGASICVAVAYSYDTARAS